MTGIFFFFSRIVILKKTLLHAGGRSVCLRNRTAVTINTYKILVE